LRRFDDVLSALPDAVQMWLRGPHLCDKGRGFFRHGQGRQQQRRQNENASHTHTAGHFKDLLA
jgi:hypothetical protein